LFSPVSHVKCIVVFISSPRAGTRTSMMFAPIPVTISVSVPKT